MVQTWHRRPNRCPCGSGATYAACCACFVEDGAHAATATELARARYSAGALGRQDFLMHTWDPRARADARAEDEEPHRADGEEWTELELVDAHAGGPCDDVGTVEVRVSWRYGEETGVAHERAHFVKRAGQWFYAGREPLSGPAR